MGKCHRNIAYLTILKKIGHLYLGLFVTSFREVQFQEAIRCFSALIQIDFP